MFYSLTRYGAGHPRRVSYRTTGDSEGNALHNQGKGCLGRNLNLKVHSSHFLSYHKFFSFSFKHLRHSTPVSRYLKLIIKCHIIICFIKTKKEQEKEEIEKSRIVVLYRYSSTVL